jgi:hypothetical protein
MEFFGLSLPVCLHQPTFSHPRQNWILKGATPRARISEGAETFPGVKQVLLC